MWGLGHVSLPALVVGITIKALLLLIAVLTLTWFMRRSSAAVRHLYLSAAALLLLVLPLASLVLPSWNLGFFTDPFAAREGKAMLTPTERIGTGREFLKEAPVEIPGLNKSTAQPGSQTTGEKSRFNWFDWVLIVWIIGVVALLLRLIGGKFYGYWLAWRAPEITDSGFIRMVEQAAHQLGIDRKIPIVESDRFKVPFVYGILTPRLIMPSLARTWPSERLKAILHHEFAHIKRKDILIQFLAQVVCCMYWINPLVWILERRLFLEREHACDDMTLRQDIKASAYAGHLMEVLEEMGNKNNKNLWVITAMAEGTDFKDRILSILNPTVQRSLLKRMHWSVVIVFTLLLLLPLGALSPWTTVESSSEESVPAAALDSRSGEESGTAEEKPGKEDKKLSPQEQHDTLYSSLIGSLESPSAALRERAVSALGELGDRRAVPALIKALRDENASVREHVTSALRKLGDKRAVQPLIETLNDENAIVREHSASALGYLGDQRAVQPLIDRLQKETNDEVRIHIINALKRLR